MLSPRLADDGVASRSLNDIQRAARDSLLRKLADGTYATIDSPCLLCGGNDLEPVSDKDRYGLPMAVQVCRGCGLVQTTPRMDADAYAGFYDDEYRPLYGGRDQATEGFWLHQVEHGQRILRWLDRHDLRPPSHSRVVEVGCGAGGILQAFAEAGYEVAGVDLGSDLIAYGRDERGLDLRVGTIDDVPGAADLLIYSHVFEHITDPLRELDAMARMLAGRGLVYLEVPGIKNLGHYSDDLLDYLQNAHVTHFSLATLQAMAAQRSFHLRAGDEVVQAAFVPPGLDEVVASGAPPSDDYESVLASLRAAERRRPWRLRLRPLERIPRRLRAVRRLGLKRALDSTRQRRVTQDQK